MHCYALCLVAVALLATLVEAGILKERVVEVEARPAILSAAVEQGREISDSASDFKDEVQQIQQALLQGSKHNPDRTGSTKKDVQSNSKTESSDVVSTSQRPMTTSTQEPLSPATPSIAVNKPVYSIVSQNFSKRNGQPNHSFSFPQAPSAADRRAPISIDRLGVSEIKSPLFQLQQQLLNSGGGGSAGGGGGGGGAGAGGGNGASASTPVTAASEEYFWETEGDADYLADRPSSNVYNLAPDRLKSTQSWTEAQQHQNPRQQQQHHHHQQQYHHHHLQQQHHQQQQQQQKRLEQLKYEHSQAEREQQQAAQAQRPDVDTYNIVITKNSTGLPRTHKLKLLPDSQVIAQHVGPRVASASELQHVVTSAVRAAVSSSSPLAFEEAVAQVIESPGHSATVNVINSTIADLGEIESALNTLLGADVVYRKMADHKSYVPGLALGYIKDSNTSVVDNILNHTLGISHHSNATKTNVVNIFIINVIGEVSDILEVNNWTKIEEKLDLDQIQSDIQLNENNTAYDGEEEKQNIQSGQKVVQYVTPQPQEVENQVPNVEVWNSQGINLNQNTVLNLLPDFVKATTITPVVPIFNTSLHQQLGTKPSVLGLLPNEVFDIEKTTVNLFDNSTGGGVIRKPIKEADIFNSNSDYLSLGYPSGHYQHPTFPAADVEQPNPVPSNPYAFRSNYGSLYDFNPNRVLEIMSSPNDPQNVRSSVVPVPQLVVPVVGSARSPSRGDQSSTESTESHEVTTPQTEEVTTYAPELSFYDIVNFTRNDDADNTVKDVPLFVKLSKDVVKNSANIKKKKNAVIAKPNTKVANDKSDADNLLSMDNMVKAFAIGALPSSVAVASALWPVWAPFVFGRRRRKRSATSQSLVPAWYSLLNGSRYHASRNHLINGSMEIEDGNTYGSSLMKTSDLAALIQAAAPSTVKVVDSTWTSVSPKAKVTNTSIISTTKRSVPENEDEKEGEGETVAQTATTRKYATTIFSPQETTMNLIDEITPSIYKLQSMLTESTTRNSVFMTSSDMEDGKSPAQDMVLVSNFLNTALNGWNSGEQSELKRTTPKNYITLNISSVASAGEGASGTTDSPIVLIDKETGELKPLSNISKNVTLHLNKSHGNLSHKLEYIRNKTAGTTIQDNIIRLDLPSTSTTLSSSSTGTSSTTTSTTGATKSTSGSTTSTTDAATTTTVTTTTTTKRPVIRTIPPVRAASAAAAAAATTTTTTAAPAQNSGGGEVGLFSLITSAITNPSPEIANAMSFVSTITVYGAAALMPLWLPLVVGKRKKRSLEDKEDEHSDVNLEEYSDVDANIKLNYSRLANKEYGNYSSHFAVLHDTGEDES